MAFGLFLSIFEKVPFGGGGGEWIISGTIQCCPLKRSRFAAAAPTFEGATYGPCYQNVSAILTHKCYYLFSV